MKYSRDILAGNGALYGLADEYPAGFADPAHKHQHAQLIYVTKGVMTVATDATTYLVSSQRAVWIPAGVQHRIVCRDSVSLRTVYINEAYDPEPEDCRAIEVSELARALLLEVVRSEVTRDTDRHSWNIAQLLLDELRREPYRPEGIPMPSDSRLLRVCEALIDDPANESDIDTWAAQASMSRRTFTRLSRQELGMSFMAWRQHVRLNQAIPLLLDGRSVSLVASDLGYESASAFTAMFHRSLGQTPSAYVAEVLARRE